MLAAYPGQARGVSADGSTVVGFSGDLLFGTLRAFRWTAATGLVDLGTLGGAQASAWDISADGRVIVGAAMTSGGRWHPFRWTAAGGMQDLGAFGSAGSGARSVSADGSTVIGGYSDAAHTVLAFRWTAQSGMQSLGTFAPGGWTVARNVSADGSVVVGYSTYSTSGTETAFRWTAAAGMEDLGGINGGLTHALDVSDDGETLVGVLAKPGQGFESFRWRRDTGFVELGALYDETFFAYACTPDANVLVGQGLLGGMTGSLRLPLCWLGEEYCGPSVSNSSLRSAFVRAAGSDVAANNQLELAAYALPTNSFGFFLASRQEGYTFPVSNSQGALCVAGAIGRFVGPGQIQNSGMTGSFALVLDLTALPTPTGSVAVQPGETWHFQAWHRDTNPTPTSNFTSAVRVTMR